MAMTMSGCISEKEIVQSTLIALNEKYNEEFVLDEFKGEKSSIISEYVTYAMDVYSREYPDIIFRVEADGDGSGFYDDYVARRVSRKVSEVIRMNLSDIRGDFFVYSEMVMGSDFKMKNADMSVEMFMEQFPGNRCAVNIYYAPDERDPDKIVPALEGVGSGLECISGNIKIFFVNEQQLKKVQNETEEYYQNYNNSFMKGMEFKPEPESIMLVMENGKITNMPDKVEFTKNF